MNATFRTLASIAVAAVVVMATPVVAQAAKPKPSEIKPLLLTSTQAATSIGYQGQLQQLAGTSCKNTRTAMTCENKFVGDLRGQPFPAGVTILGFKNEAAAKKQFTAWSRGLGKGWKILSKNDGAFVAYTKKSDLTGWPVVVITALVGPALVQGGCSNTSKGADPVKLMDCAEGLITAQLTKIQNAAG